MKASIKLFKKFIYLLPTIIFFISWELGGRMASHPLFPPCSKVLTTFFILWENKIIPSHLLSSLLRVTIGFLLGSTAGFLIGVLMGINSQIEKSLRPLFSIFFPIPTIGWLPLLMLWIGINEALPITLIFICAFFPVLYNTITGIKEVKAEYVKAAYSLGATPLFTLWKVIIPLALPNIFTGLRLEAGMAWRTVIAAEMFAVPTGIGALLINAETLIRVDIIMVCLLILAIMCTLFEQIFLWLEKWATSTWR